MNSYTQYQIETKVINQLTYKYFLQSKLPSYDPNKVYLIQRRFADYEWLHYQLSDNENYKGLIIPPLPEKKYLGNLDNQFIEKRKEELDNFLKVISTHQILKFDQQLCAFLTLDDFDKYRVNPSAFQKVLEYADYIPNVKNLSISSI